MGGPGQRFLDDLAAFRDFGTVTAVETAGGLPEFANAFWTSRQRQSHPLHEVSYRACFKAQLPAFLIDRLTRQGETVIDPFMGRGTTVLEAVLRGRAAIGSDINPLSVALVRSRLAPPTLAEVGERLAEIPWARFTAPERDDLLTFYHPRTLAEIEGLRGWFATRGPDLDPVDDWIRMVAINRLTGHSPGFFSVYSLPPNQAVSLRRQQVLNARRALVPPRRDVPALILEKSRGLLARGGPSGAVARLLTGPADRLQGVADAASALAVTSPPFLDVVDYAGDNWLRCWFLGIDPAAVAIDRHRSLADWRGFVAASLTELARVVRPGGHVAFEVGEVRNGKVALDREVVAVARGLGEQGVALTPLCVMINRQDFTKTARVWGVANNARGTNSNRIVVLRRD